MNKLKRKIAGILTAAAELVAVYRPNGTATVHISVENGAQYYVNDGETVRSGDDETVQLGKTITTTAVDSDMVLQWQNESGKLLGKGASISFTAVGNTTVKLVYKTAVSGQSIVQFVSDYGQVLLTKQYSKTDNTISFAGQPTKFGYNFDKWVFEGTTDEATESAIKAKIGTGCMQETVT